VDSVPSASVAAVWRQESARLIGALTRMTRDLGLAEDLAQDALVAALEQWPRDGVPGNPGAWLMAIAKRRAIDHFRQMGRRHRQSLARVTREDRPRGVRDRRPARPPAAPRLRGLA
jgi:predicted RNA polymerase sigma factor